MIKFLEWFSTIFSLIAAILTSINVYPLNIYLSVVTSITWIIWGIRTSNKGIVVVNIGFGIIFLIGSIKSLYIIFGASENSFYHIKQYLSSDILSILQTIFGV